MPPPERTVFDRIFTLNRYRVPLSYSSEEARQHVASRFRSDQPIDVRQSLEVNNIVWDEATLFSPFRAGRPIQQTASNQIEILEQQNPKSDCDLCLWRDRTPSDPFGRIESNHCITVANPGAYVGWHSLVVPKEIHHPLELTEEVFVEMIRTGNEWFRAVNLYDPAARYPTLGINILPRAGASLFHPHLQEFMRSG